MALPDPNDKYREYYKKLGDPFDDDMPWRKGYYPWGTDDEKKMPVPYKPRKDEDGLIFEKDRFTIKVTVLGVVLTVSKVLTGNVPHDKRMIAAAFEEIVRMTFETIKKLA